MTKDENELLAVFEELNLENKECALASARFACIVQENTQKSLFGQFDKNSLGLSCSVK